MTGTKHLLSWPLFLLLCAAPLVGCGPSSKGSAGSASTTAAATSASQSAPSSASAAGAQSANAAAPAPSPALSQSPSQASAASSTQAAPLGLRHWHVNDTFGNPLKTMSAAEADLALEVLQLVNRERAAHGLSPLQFSAEAQRAAVAHSADMVGRNYFSHFTPEGWSLGMRLERVHGGQAPAHRSAAENIAAGQSTAAEVMRSWMNSAGHRANILGPFTHLGTGVQGGPVRAWTQVFLAK